MSQCPDEWTSSLASALIFFYQRSLWPESTRRLRSERNILCSAMWAWFLVLNPPPPEDKGAHKRTPLESNTAGCPMEIGLVTGWRSVMQRVVHIKGHFALYPIVNYRWGDKMKVVPLEQTLH